MATRVMIMAGGTGGHVFPALAVAEELRARGCDVSWLGTPDSFEARTVPQHGFALDTIDAQRLRGQGLAGKLLAPLHLLRAMLQARRILRLRRPQVLLGMGGFASGPGGLVGRLLRLPLVIHEQNAVPGLTNRVLARLATRTLQAFPGSFPAARRAQVCGNPVRAGILALPAPQARFAARTGDAPLRLLVVGGSLGAQALNALMPQALALLAPAQRPQVTHQAGRGKYDRTVQQYLQAGVTAEVHEFLDDMPAAYRDAQLVVCRAGALTISELAAAGVAALLVPYPFAVDDHQTRNAQFLVEAGAASLLQERELTPQRLADVLRELCASPQRLHKMAEAARALARPQATACVADACLEVAA
jgi:UDP-N-acetylglucosamine--N-acetylmuramyl-(pentapeptide) pyrophosphoryl-undecaprenol N-acetylglucosamine transferase